MRRVTPKKMVNRGFGKREATRDKKATINLHADSTTKEKTTDIHSGNAPNLVKKFLTLPSNKDFASCASAISTSATNVGETSSSVKSVNVDTIPSSTDQWENGSEQTRSQDRNLSSGTTSQEHTDTFSNRQAQTALARASLIRDPLEQNLIAPKGAQQSAAYAADKEPDNTRALCEGGDDIEEHEISALDAEFSRKGEMAYLLLKTTNGNELIGLIDTGANCCLISEESAKRNNLVVEKTVRMRLKGVGSDDVFVSNIYKVPFNNKILYAKSYNKLTSKVRTSKLEKFEIQILEQMGKDTSALEKLHNSNGKIIDMILGTDIIWQLFEEAEFKRVSNEKTLVCTSLGEFIIPTSFRTLRGEEMGEEVYTSEAWIEEEFDSCNQITEMEEDEADLSSTALEKMWRLNVLGLETPELAKEEQSHMEDVLAEFQKTVTWENGNLLVKLPMNGSEIHLENNLPIAMQRLKNQFYKLT